MAGGQIGRRCDLRRARVAVGLALVGATVTALALLADAPSADAQSSRSPYGRLDAVQVIGPGAVRISGWAIDPDSPAPISVIVSANGRLAGGRAGLGRRDLPRSTRNRGYSFVVTGLRPGPTQVCAGAFNVGPGDPGRLIGCALVNTGGPEPLGSIESLAATGATTLRLSGWALDPDTPFPTPVEVVVDGSVAVRVVASGSRSDIGQLFPGWTPFHGVTADLTVSEGLHQICLRPQNLGRGRTVDVSCRAYQTPDVNPLGSFDNLSVLNGNLIANGWGFERDQATAPQAVVSIDQPGPDDVVRLLVNPGLVRPDVAVALSTSQLTGFSQSWTPTRPGPHQVCVGLVNRGWGSDRLIGCRTVEVSEGRPVGDLERIVAGTGSVRVQGWVDEPGDTSPVSVRVTSDRTSQVAVAVANQTRNDLGTPNPGGAAQVGYSVDLTGLVAGAHRICLEATDRTGPSGATVGNRRWCGAALVGGTRIGLVEGGEIEAAVGPAAGSPIADVDRDGGVSVRLSDGSLLWLFGDSAAKAANGTLRYFVSGTAAWAAAGSPEVTRDGVEDGRPVTAASPAAGFPACSAARPTAAMWPMSAVAIPDGPVDRVIAWFANMCLGPQPSFQAVGTSVAEFIYDPSDPPVDRPVRFTITNQQLWNNVGPGEAAVADISGDIIVYDCNSPDQGGWFSQYGPCVAARVDPEDVGDPSSYQFWDGAGWTADRSTAASLILPSSGEGGVGTYPPAAFTVAADPALERFVMTYTSWPGFTPTTWIRVASSPTGPWSEAMRHDVAGCPATIGGATLSCYASTAQPAASSGGRLGLGAYRQWLPEAPSRGGYRLFGIRLAVGP